MDDTPPGSPTTPITPFQAQYGLQHQQLQLQQLQLQQQRSKLHSPPPSRSPTTGRAFGQSSHRHAPASPSSAAAPGADTSINSISSMHSYSSYGSQGHSGIASDGAANIISNSVFTSAANQSIASPSEGGGGGVVGDVVMNGDSSFFSSATRGISSDLSRASPTGGPSLQQHRGPSNDTLPTNSGAITRPPMSAHRTRDSAPGKSVSNSIPAHINTSFSSIGSAEGEVSAALYPGSIIQNAVAEAAAQEGSSMAQAPKPPVGVSAALVNLGESVDVVSGLGVSSVPTLTAASSALPERRTNNAGPAPSASSGHSHRNQQNRVPAPSGGRNPSSSGDGQSRSHGQNHGAKKHRPKVEVNRDAPRPSMTVLPAPTPAMHWTLAKVHGQVPPKDLRAQTVTLVGESIYVFGGSDAKNCFNTLYIFDADTMHWSQPKTFGSIPPPCRAHSAALVDNRHLYVFGGGDGPQYFNDLHMLDTDTLTWTNPPTTGTRPCQRRAHTTCVYNNQLYIFGGGDGVRALNDTHALDLATMHWTEIKTTGTVPLCRGYHTSNLIKSKYIVYGGSDGHEFFSDVHILDLDTKEWTRVEPNEPVKRLSHTSTQVGSYLFVVGGHDGSRYSSDVMMLNLMTWNWEPRKVYGIPPAGRGYHASLLYDSRLFMFGGYDGQRVFDDIYILDLSTCAYLPQITDFTIEAGERDDKWSRDHRP